MTPRKTAALAFNLPPGAATWLALGVDAAWTTEAHQLATLSDILNAANWQRGGCQGSRPKPLPRPREIREASEREARVVAKAEDFIRRNPN